MSRCQYVNDDESPLLKCPGCKMSLTREGGVNMLLSIGGCVVEVRSQLDEDGYLADTEDAAVAKGFHSMSECAFCSESLVDFEVTTFS